MPKVTVPLTRVPAAALAGTEIVVDTSALADIDVVADAASGRAFGPCEVVVKMPLDSMIAPPASGAVYATPIVSDEPAPRLAGIPLKVTVPLPALYVADAPTGRPLNWTPESDGASVSV